jgi:calcium-dependent protein kinase
MGKCSSRLPHCPEEASGFPKATKSDAKMFILRNNDVRIRDRYAFGQEPLGVRADGHITKGTLRSNGLVHIVKTTRKRAQNVERLEREMAILKKMDHQNIVKLVETFEDQRSIHLVFEFCAGGLLMDRICAEQKFSERDAAVLMKQILSAVFFMHQNGVCHRGLTLDKFMFQNEAPMAESVLKLVNFDSACFFEEGTFLQEKVSTKCSSFAPEVSDGRYNEKCDLWSCGVMLFMLLSGRPPFSGNTEKEVRKKVQRADFDFDKKYWSRVSEDAQSLIRKMLKVRVQDRISAKEALQHAWILEMAPKATSSVNLEFLNDLKSLRSASKLKKVALQVMVVQFNQNQIGDLRNIFNALDENGDGMLTMKEIREGLMRAGLQDITTALQQSLEDIDLDGSGLIDYSEFLAAALEKKHYLQEDACWNAFKFFDRDGDGCISVEELRQVLNSRNWEEEIGEAALEQAMQEVDKNGDGQIDFDEFMEMMRHSL